MPLHKGYFIGAYEIVAPLGQGGMATVYKAYHARLNRFVAIKMIHQAYLLDPNYLARFEREAQIVAGLEHPHIVPVYDFSEHEGEPYLVMKLIEGRTLKAVLNERVLPASEALTLITPIAEALDYAHARGVLHRDVKPSNILIDPQGTPFLTDFGLARLSLSGASSLSQDQMIGTPYYMSPEQASGKGEIDHRADLYSFGVVLFELFVGQVPFRDGTPYAIITDHIQRELPLPSSLNPDVLPSVEAVLLQALAKDPNDRYQSAAELAAAMRDATNVSTRPNSFLIRQSERAEPDTLARQAAPLQPQDPPLKPAAAAKPRISCSVEIVLTMIVVALVAVLVTTLALRSQRPPPPPTEVAQVPTAEPTITATFTLPPRRQTILPTQPAQNGPAPAVPLLEVPQMTAVQARAAIQRSPNDPVGYLALAREQLRSGEDLAARRTIADGMSHASDHLRFLMTAADSAVQIERYDAAFALYSSALQEAIGTPPYPAVRETAGRYLYGAATLNERLSLLQIRTLEQDVQNNPSPIVSAMIGRAFLTSGMPRLAEVGINKALAEDSTLAEAHLVNGELLHSRGDSSAARDEWRQVLDAPDAPAWVRDRANQLINSLTSP